MARRPFFSGNYGSALGSYDTAAKLLAQAGQTQGAAMAGLGANIGGAIQKYQLNKEKRDEAQRSLEANIGYMAQNDPETLAKFKQEYAKDFAALEKDGGNAKTISNLNAGMAVWKDRLTADLNRNLKESQVRNLESENRMKTLQNKLTERTQDFDVEKRKLTNKLLDSQAVLAALEAAGFTEKQKAQLDSLRAGTKQTEVVTAGLPTEDEAALDRMADLETKLTSLKIKRQELKNMPGDAQTRRALAEVDLVLKGLTAEKLKKETEQIGKPKPFEQRTIPLEPGDYQTSTGVYRRETLGGPLIKVGTPSEGGAGIVPPDISIDPSAQDVAPGEIIDPDTAAGGDFPGWGSDIANAIGGVFGLNPFPERTEAVNQLKILNQEVRPLLVKDLSKLGAVSLVAKMDEIMPIPSDNNAELKQKIHGLVGLMETRVDDLRRIDKAVQAKQMKVDEVTAREIRSWLTRLPKQIARLKASMGEQVSRIPPEIRKITGSAPQGAPPPSSIQGMSRDQLLQMLQQP